MKLFIQMIIVISLTLSLIGCGGDKKEKPPETMNGRYSKNNPLVDDGKWTKLHKAVDAQDLQGVTNILRKNTNVNVIAPGEKMRKTTPLHLAATGGKVLIVNLLLENGADVSLKETTGATALHKAVEKGHLDIVEILVGKGADVNAYSFYVHSPLKLAKDKGHTDIASFLLSRGAKEN